MHPKSVTVRQEKKERRRCLSMSKEFKFGEAYTLAGKKHLASAGVFFCCVGTPIRKEYNTVAMSYTLAGDNTRRKR